MNSVQISKNIYWVGKVDDRKVPFHRLVLERGTTYNSYLLKTEQPTIIDTVDIQFGREYVENLSQIVDLEEIKYIVINHVEPDHAGALPVLAAKAKNAAIVTTKLGAEILKEMFKLHKRKFIEIKDGDTLDIGGKVLKFFETPYLHTQETMITYAIDDKILFPCDIFSTHIANNELFNDLAESEYIEDFKVYYKLIMSPHRTYVRDMLGKIEDLLKSLESEELSNKFAAAFASYGWSGEAILHIEDYLQKSGFNVINQRFIIGNTGMDLSLFPLRIKFANEEGLEKSKESGRFFGEQVLAKELVN